jgi:hypothetical protein
MTLVALALVLAVVAWGLFRLVGWLHGDRLRYFYFDLFAALFVLALGLIVLANGPRDAFFVPMGILLVLSGGTGLGALLAQRFGLSGPTGTRYSFSDKTARSLAGRGSLRCSFCNKSQRDVAKLIAGPAVFICDECVAICQSILDKRPDLPPDGAGQRPTVN